MAKKRFSPEQIVILLRQIELATAPEKKGVAVRREAAIRKKALIATATAVRRSGTLCRKTVENYGKIQCPTFLQVIDLSDLLNPAPGTKLFFHAKFFNRLEREFAPPQNSGYHHLLGNGI